LLAGVSAVVRQLKVRGERIDYLTFVPDGEPTLDIGLGDQLRLLRTLGIPLAVITNASLLSREDVRSDLAGADRVSVKVDAVRHESWRRIDRPHGDLRLETVLDGILQFSRSFTGELDTETMLVDGMNDSDADIRPLAAFLQQVKPARSYVSIPTRPPAVAGVQPASEHSLVRAYETLAAAVPQVELLTGYEGTSFASTGDARADILAITAVHPMRSDQVDAVLDKCGATRDVVEWLVRQQTLTRVDYGGQCFYLRRLNHIY
jgi:wyosine [tRNA(Phe)-imidazoG37] synthetase (radical SAM superfamily)